ncbi:hypothetical protein GWI33_007049 [Rhynchophorus ferrugineus]|uniref:Uncharacterized protein n=1 Tax=Rhynchophorus ferrugineus TaxID=354439 RepID=A0A834IET2_RHYFE|nr:hypothetical protein GWI33_007049 [Rhynchophorus ferrugineus]
MTCRGAAAAAAAAPAAAATAATAAGRRSRHRDALFPGSLDVGQVDLAARPARLPNLLPVDDAGGALDPARSDSEVHGAPE